jgi:hypothetical protein
VPSQRLQRRLASRMNFDLNKSMIALAENKAAELAKELQADAVIVIIAHSGKEIAVGHANGTKESEESVGAILRDVADGWATERGRRER